MKEEIEKLITNYLESKDYYVRLVDVEDKKSLDGDKKVIECVGGLFIRAMKK